jgi:thiamine biosynthesis protein ThiS
MKLVINGDERTFEAVASMTDLLERLGIEPQVPGVAVARNGQVVPRRDLDRTPLNDGDRIEIVRAVQGG